MLKNFKFLQILKKPRKSIGMIKLKEEFNRNKHLIFIWSEYPTDGDDSNLLEFTGNILEFYNFTRGNSPTIYEIYIKETGYFDLCIVFNRRQLLQKFIRRKAKLKIIYSNSEN